MEEYLKEICDQISNLSTPVFLSWIAAIGSALTFFVVCFYIFQYIFNNRRHKYEKAIEFAKTYVNEILPNIGYILKLYESADVEDITHKVRNEEINNFDIAEYQKILSDSEQKRMKDAFNNIDLNEFIEAHEKYFFSPYPDSITEFDLNNLPDYISPPRDKEKMLYRIFKAEYDQLLARLLNTLETIAMGFVLKVANEKAVYCSLHQSYIETIKILFLKIAPLNDKAEDKYYSYIISLYQIWNCRHVSSLTKKAKYSYRLGFPGKPLSG